MLGNRVVGVTLKENYLLMTGWIPGAHNRHIEFEGFETSGC